MKKLAWITGLLTLLLAVFSFVLSFNALTDLASQHGVSIPPLFPFVVEFAVVIFSVNALYRSLHNEPAKVQWILIIFSSILAGLFNIAHVESGISEIIAPYINPLMAAMPSLFLLLSFESFLNLIRYQVTRQGAKQNLETIKSERNKEETKLQQSKDELAKVIVQISNQKHNLDEQKAQLEAQISELQSAIENEEKRLKEAKNGTIEPDPMLLEATFIDGWVAAGGTQKDVSKKLGISTSTVRNRLKELNGNRVS